MSALSTLFPKHASTDIRTATDADSRRRRTVAGLAALAAGDFLLGVLYQTGLVRRLPEPRLPGVDSMRVMSSRAAYPLGVPDTTLALAFEAIVIALATASGRRRPAGLELAFGAATIAGGAAALAYGSEMVRQKRLCLYCTVAIGAMLAAVPLGWPSLRAGLRALVSR